MSSVKPRSGGGSLSAESSGSAAETEMRTCERAFDAGGGRSVSQYCGLMHHVAAACLKVSHAHLTTKVGLHPAMVTVPFAKIEEGDLVLHHGRPTQLMYQRLAAPDTLTSACGSQQGGPLVLYRKSGGHFAPLGIEDGKLLAVASDLMQKAVGF